MNINKVSLLNSIKKYSLFLKSENLVEDDLNKFLRLTRITPTDIDEIVEYLVKRVSNPLFINSIGRYFGQFLIVIITKLIYQNTIIHVEQHRRNCVTIAKLIDYNSEILKYTYDYFSNHVNPFIEDDVSHEDKKQKTEGLPIFDKTDFLNACLQLLKSDYLFFRDVWNWAHFMEHDWKTGTDEQKQISNEIVAYLINLNSNQLDLLNKEFSNTDIVKHNIIHKDVPIDEIECDEEMIKWEFWNDRVTVVEDVFLKVYDADNCRYACTDDIVKVNSTRRNLKNIALGISSNQAICLSGSVGSGKTTLVEYLAKLTGRLLSKTKAALKCDTDKSKLNGVANSKRKHNELEISNLTSNNKTNNSDGFLKIQLGDQTDGKMLLGQYRCTDVPGEFVWQAGILTQAVINGSWILLEDLNLASQDVCSIISNLLENNYLSVPGFRDYIKIEPGFQIFFTLRTQKDASHHISSQLLEKYLYTVNLLPLSHEELVNIVKTNYSNLAQIAGKIVDVFLNFSSGCHNDDGFINNNLMNIPNSGRLVSTRDLLKLCNRSNPNFLLTSSECAYFVFQNAVDLFCSHLPSGDKKTGLIVEIGSKLGIIESRCVSLANQYKANIANTSDTIKVGRVEMLKKIIDDDFELSEIEFNVVPLKKRKIDKNLNKSCFSFTRLSSCLLERVAVSVDQNEPVLLVGETGVGKTSSIQYLSNQTNHKLVVINMNNQSDVSDLLGGFKPVDLYYVLLPIRNEFEYLFKQTFNVIKNEKFLNNLSICFNRGDYEILIKLMIRIVERLFLGSGKNIISSLKNNWTVLRTKLMKLHTQIEKKSINISFAFIPGSLVNCIKNGDWILLDEINLASSETLECLTSILEPDGSVILLEKGDLLPIKRHSDFRIFACMNPSTDIGKKDLPISIRNRFTEFFVDELTDENDLMILVEDYLQTTGIQKTKVYSIVKLYKKLRELAYLKLNDGLGNRPVYSLRTLCRALCVCAKNLCGSIERNIYESVCLSFLTQLEPESHKIVLDLIQASLLTNTKAVLSQQLPQPQGEFINFEGYWIQKGNREVAECSEYILTDSVKSNLKDLARIISIAKLPILLQGPTSAGKTSLIDYIAKKSGNYCLRINNHEHTDLQEYIGTYITNTEGKLIFQEGVLVQAMRNGYWIILDELNLAPSDILEALNRVLDDNRELFITETQTLVKAHPNFMLFATQNPPGIYGGRKTLSRAFKNRFIELHFSEIPKSELEIILEKRCLIPKSYAQKMVKTMSELQIHRKNTSGKNIFTLRDLFRWGNRYSFADKKLLENNAYDWNQHLVDEGYLVLSSKIRNTVESAVISDALFHHFRKKINIDQLFTLDEKTSMVTKTILEKFTSHKSETYNIVWTSEMRRIAVLVGKAIQFDEPILLIGPTGCGKTTICQIGAELFGKELRILNCHMHTEGADFLGGLRPYRGDSNDKFFEWHDGPLVMSMKEGSLFLADEISLAEDSVLERLNCILEPERTVLLSEKGGIEDTTKDDIIIKAAPGFQFLATMNPGGDFGKKELSPALRNRFTEIWCRPTESRDELIVIVDNLLKFNNEPFRYVPKIIIDTVFYLKENIEKFNFSVRDILAFANYIKINIMNVNDVSLEEYILYGLDTVFLDSLEMLPFESNEEIEGVKRKIRKFVENQMKEVNESFASVTIRPQDIEITENQFGIYPFYLKLDGSIITDQIDFVFSAPTTKTNLFRLLSALSLNKSILLEGPPGVGKTTLIENIAKSIGYQIVRINLCEHTDLADLFGTDLPDDEDILENENLKTNVGTFVWRDGPLLSALKSQNTWILLDELNLAPQSVLEGLNAILDHRGEVYIPELNKSFKLGNKSRIFAAQNPLKQGGGRKGLPQSFLNRFTKVYLKKLEKLDLLYVIRWKFGENFKKLNEILQTVDVPEKMVEFSELLETGIRTYKFGLKGGPYETNLRDILRWCSFLFNSSTGLILHSNLTYADFVLILFEKMKIVYYERMRSEADQGFICSAFQEIFKVDAIRLNKISNDISLYWTNDKIYMNDIVLYKNENLVLLQYSKESPIILESQVNVLKTIFEAHIMEQPIILSGATDCGKTKSIDLFCSILNRGCVVDSIDDSVTGSFQQIDYNRHLEEIARMIELSLLKIIHSLLVNDKEKIIKLFNLWENYRNTSKTSKLLRNDEVSVYRNRIFILEMITRELEQYDVELVSIKRQLNILLRILEKTNTLNTGGRFEWVDSKVVKAIKNGEVLCLEHVNLCSSAVLDRLNSVLEPNGKLLISEKGVTVNDQSELIGKHQNFRIFLTLDPRNGEISRAMRNRCVEINFNRENYTENDIRKLVYNVGIHELFLINAIISIHSNLKANIEFNNFGLSHILKFSFLVLQHIKLGDSTENSLRISSHEAYVVSSTVDLMGYGLKFYRKKLSEIIEQSLNNFKVFNNNCNFENILIKSKQMTPIKLIKLQYEPYLTLLNGNNESLLHLSTNYGQVVHKLNNVKFNIDYLLNLLFNMSSNDVDLRAIYLDKLINDEHIKQLNTKLYHEVNESNIEMSDVPWNSTIFPRIRDYMTNGSTDLQDMLKLSLTLLLRVILNTVQPDENMKMDCVTVLTYSKAVKEKLITDSINNLFINNIYEFLSNFENYLLELIKGDFQTMDLKSFIDLSCSFLWFNRILKVSHNKMIINKKLNEPIVSSLIQHFKWMSKYIFSKIKPNKIIDLLGGFILDKTHPLHKIRKMFLKTYTNFLPFYNAEQIVVFEKMKEFDKNVPDQVKFTLLKLYSSNVDEFIWLRDLTISDISDISPISEDILKNIKIFMNKCASLPIQIESRTDDDFDMKFRVLELQLENIIEPTINTIDVVKEYFGIKGLNILLTGNYKTLDINSIYYNNMRIMSLFVLHLINKTDTAEYQMCEKLWSSVTAYIYNVFNDDKLICNIKDLIRVLPRDYYKNYSTFNKNLIKTMKSYELESSLTKIDEIFSRVDKYDLVTNSSVPINGRPILTKIMFEMLLNSTGNFKSVGLIEMNTFACDLKVIKNLMWNNILTAQMDISYERSNLFLSLNGSIKLLNELKDIVENWHYNALDEEYLTYKENFINLYTYLESTCKSVKAHINKSLPVFDLKLRDTELKFSSILYTLLGTLELNLLTYAPDLDPVERNNLKMAYILEDENHINNMLLSYDIQRVIMNYNSLGEVVYDQLKTKLDELNGRKVKFSKKVALRHEDCKYNELVRNITHFLLTCCHPKTIYSLISKVSNSLSWNIDTCTDTNESVDRHIRNINEQVNIIETMLKNIVRFEKTLQKFALYYRDFIDPIEYSLTILKFGLNGLINCLIKSRDVLFNSINTKQYYNINRDEKLVQILEDIIEYPKTNCRDIICADLKSPVNIFRIMENVDKSNIIFMNLLKSKLYDLRNQIIVQQNIDEPRFQHMEQVYNAFNRIWQQQEEQRKKRQAEEDSLYVTKTKCEAEDEELIKLKEIKEIFPNYAEEDFSEFVVGQTLEQVKTTVGVSAKKAIIDEVIDEQNYEFICENFIKLLMNYGSTYYYNNKPATTNLDFISPFETRIAIFQRLFNKYQSILSTQIDDDFYPNILILIGISQQNYKELELYKKPDIEYNFYKDSNISEVTQCLEVLKDIDLHVTRELNEWPDHAVLLDLKKIIEKIYSIPANSSMVRFNTGFQILRQKIDEWNKYAHKGNNLKAQEITVAGFVQRWTKLELQYWRECLSQTYNLVRNKSYKYWFFIYNMIHEYLTKNNEKINKNSINFKDTRNIEKIFEENEGLDELINVEKEILNSNDIVGILKSFVENSNYADFSLRMKVMKSFEIYLNLLLKSNYEQYRSIKLSKEDNRYMKRIQTLIAIFHNLVLFFEQFRTEIDDGLKKIRTPIEKRLKEFVKIESYTKDLSYFSMKNNIMHVHKNLHKFLKEYENQLRVKVTSAFTYKSNLGSELVSDREEKGKNFRYEAKIKYYMIDVKNFMALNKLEEKYKIITIEQTNLKYFPKLKNLFLTSRNIVKQIVLHASYPSLVYNLDALLTEQIETCEYLKNLEIDRTQERTKQVSQSKSILSQKKKALADLFKILTMLGISYKAGLLELNLNTEITNLKIAPFCANEMLSKLNLNHKRNESNLIYLNENINSYYFKCIFKLKLLFNSLQQLNPEIGPDNGSRIKGFSVDMFVLIQNQKIALSESIKNLYELRLVIKDLSELNEVVRNETIDSINFLELTNEQIKLIEVYSEIKLVFEQFLLLLKTVPDPDDDNTSLKYSVLKGFNFNSKSDIFATLYQNTNQILEIANSQLSALNKLKKIRFISNSILYNINSNLKNIKLLILDIVLAFKDEDNHISMLKPITYLVGLINELDQTKKRQTKSHAIDLDLYENEFDNIIYNILLSIQTIYKKYSKNEDQIFPTPNENIEDQEVTLNDSTEKQDNILEQHLKSKIDRSIEADLKILNYDRVVEKLQNLLQLVFKAESVDTAKKLVFIKKLISLVPLIEQYNLLGEYYLIQQLAAHNVSTKMLSILLSVFIELVTKGFCIPQDLMKDEDGDKSKDKNEGKGEGFGLEDGTGENDVSDRIENEDQLEDAKRPEEYNEEKEENDCKEEKGVEMSEDFDSKLQDLQKDDKNDDSDSESEKSDVEDLDKEMDKTNEGAEKLDEQIWGDDDNNEDENDELEEEEDGGKGSDEKDDKHNDLGSQNEKDDKNNTNDNEDGLDAVNNEDGSKERKEKERDIDKINETDETGEEQPNPHHNELEDPPEAEDFDLDENLNVDDDDDGKEGNENETNPFDIDTMKDQMVSEENVEGDDEEDEPTNDNDKQIKENDEKEEDPEFGTEEKSDEKNEEDDENVDDDKETDTQAPANTEEEGDEEKENKEPETEDETKQKKENDYHESKDKRSNEDNIQAKPDTDNANSTKDQTKFEDSVEKQQNDAIDEQDTGEDKDGIGQAENEISESGHQGVTEQNKPAESKNPADQNEHKQKQRKQGSSEEERTLSEKKNEQNKRLKTIDKIKDENNMESEENEENLDENEADEYQHVKEPKKTDKSTLDCATEEQSRKIQHDDNEKPTEENKSEENDEVMEIDDEEPDENKIEETIDSEKLDMSEKKAKKQKQQNDKLKEQFNAGDENEETVEGEAALTYKVQRPTETTAHTKIEIASDHTLIEASVLDDINMRKTIEIEKQSSAVKTTGYSAESYNFDLWQEITNKMQSNARELCEQLRLILEPTKCTRLKGDYRTGRRINMRKIIPYIASQFRKDKIWLRRTKPAQRDYKITIAIDDSKSMDHNQSKYLTLESISLVSQALTLLESGKLNVISFGERPQIILNYHDQFDGLKLVNTLNFAQNQSRIAELLNFVRVSNLDDGGSSGNCLFENLLLIISDGRNIFSEGEEKVKNAVKLARLQHIFIVYIIIDNPENKHSILDIRVPKFGADKTITMSSYLDSFPFPYYVIVRDLNQLPIVLSDAMRQWFELVNSEQ